MQKKTTKAYLELLAFAAAAGQAGACDALLTASVPLLHYLAAKAARRFRLPEHAAEDIAQEAALRVIEKIREYSTMFAFSTWLGRQVDKCARSEMRRGRWGMTCDIDEVALPAKDNPEAALLLGETLVLLETHPQEAQDMIAMSASGLSEEEIANTTGKSTHAVHKRLQRTRKSLRALVDDSDNRAA
jgi:RNA polymerase sigma factor (sigma-70 family)